MLARGSMAAALHTPFQTTSKKWQRQVLRRSSRVARPGVTLPMILMKCDNQHE
jgi:hypothetical protein